MLKFLKKRGVGVSSKGVGSACETLAGMTFRGERKEGFWKITEKVLRAPDGSGGNFSVGYLAVHEDGTEAFVKATDIGLLTRGASLTILERMHIAAAEQKFERAVLEVCRGNNLDRIVHAIDHAEFEIVHDGIRDVVFLILFERADGDVRRQMSKAQRAGLSWILHALHNLATAIQQLHRHRIAHNDVKPSNFLVFDEWLQKLADMGRATADDTSGPWDKVKYSGDPSYAAPEFHYPGVDFAMDRGKISFSVRQASDLFHLGSMAFFLVTGEKIMPVIRMHLRPEHQPNNWQGIYRDVTPYLRDALGQSMRAFDDQMPRLTDGTVAPEGLMLRTAILQLCDPDPSMRGHPQNTISGVEQFNLERYISQFIGASKSVALRERH